MSESRMELAPILPSVSELEAKLQIERSFKWGLMFHVKRVRGFG